MHREPVNVVPDQPLLCGVMAGRLVIFLLWLVHSGLLVLVHSAASTPLYIKAGTVVNADRQFKAHVLIVDGKVSAVGPDVQASRAAASCHSLVVFDNDSGTP